VRPVDIAIRAALGIIRVAAILLYRIRLHRLVMWMNRRRPRVLLYHACEPDESPFIRGLRSNTHPVTFAAQLAFLVRHGYCVIPVERLANGPIPERAVAITFDDGYRSVFTAAYPLLRGQGLPATVYLVSDVVDNDRLVWVNELNWFLHAHAEIAGPMIRRALGLSADVGHEAIIATAHERYDRDLIAVALATLRAATGTDPAGSRAMPASTLAGPKLRRWPPAGSPSATTPQRTRTWRAFQSPSNRRRSSGGATR
jgi:hypothetical protein